MHKGIDIDIESLRAQLEAHRQELLILLTAASASTEPVELDQQIQGRLSRMDALQVQAMAQATNDRRRIEIAQIDAALALVPIARTADGAEEIAAVGGIETLVGLSLNDSQLETYAFRTVLRAIGHVEPLRQRVLDAHSAKMRQVRERASE